MSRTRTLMLALAAIAVVASVHVPATAGAVKPKRQFYVSLGDSYATGFQPSVVRQSAGTRNGFAYRLIAELIVKTLPRR